MKKILGLTFGLLVLIIAGWWAINPNSLLLVSEFLFVTDKNKMNWIGFTGLIAIAGLVYNLYDGRRRFRGDIISKSRIDWMKTVRTLVANFISDYDLLLITLNNESIEASEARKDVKELVTRLKRTYNEILLYVPDNKSNELLLENIKKLYFEISSENTSPNKYKNVSEKRKLFRKTVQDASEYFKNEWESAKKGD